MLLHTPDKPAFANIKKCYKRAMYFGQIYEAANDKSNKLHIPWENVKFMTPDAFSELPETMKGKPISEIEEYEVSLLVSELIHLDWMAIRLNKYADEHRMIDNSGGFPVVLEPYACKVFSEWLSYLKINPEKL